MGAVHQFIPTYSSRDAIGTHARHVRSILRELGVESEIYAEGISPGVRRGDAHLFKSFPATSDALLLYQLSTGCKMADWLLARPERKVVNYHNVTPFTVFGAWEPIVGAELRRGREQLADFAPRTEMGIAVSHFNEAELRATGFERTAVAPVLVDLDAMASAPDAATVERLHEAKARGGADWLFVGRVAPHKCQHDLVKAFALYRRVYDPKARLHIVGSSASHAYSTALERYIRALGLHRNVHLHGSVPDDVLAAYYASADAFVCLSMHEGFCVPLIEAMRSRLPIVAHAAAAVPETLAGAGVLLDLKDPATVAAAVHRVTTDAALRAGLTEAGLRRAADFAFDRTRARFVAVMEDLLSRSGGAGMRALHQFVATFEPGATGAHMLELQRLARDVLGIEGELFAEYRRGPHADAVKHHREYRPRPGDVVVYHMAIGSVVADFVADQGTPLVVDFHNITPAHFIEPWEPGAAYGCAWGRNQLRELAATAEVGIAHSRYSEDELRHEGFPETAVAPILLDLSSFEAEVDELRLRRLVAAKNDGGRDWLFVGRLSPNKCQHDLVKALAVHRRLYDPEARLHLVGGSSSDAYAAAIEGYAAELGLADAVDVTGAVTPGELAAYYKAADVFVCVSEHEGFCVPLVEAMWNNVPVVAYASSAVPETLGDGGVLLPAKDGATVAAAVDRVLCDRDAVIAAGTERLRAFDLAHTRAQWVDLLQRVPV